jgi:hypothetical protein
VFGRRKREEQKAESAREAERRALFVELAKRPDTVCPFLGLADARAAFRPEPNGEHRCYAFGDPSPLSDEQQRNVCLERGYSNCPRYLRGVLVIPSEELEALRRPQAPPPPPPPAPLPASGGGRRGLALVAVLVLLIAAGGAGGWYLLNQRGPGVAVTTSSPSPAATGTPATTSVPTTVPTAVATASASQSALPTPTPEPTPAPADHFDHWEVGVGPQHYTLFVVDPQQGVTGTREQTFGDFSRTPVVPGKTAAGLVYWETSAGDLTGFSYIWGQSGDFQLREVYLTPQGQRRVVVMTAAQATTYPTATPAPR